MLAFNNDPAQAERLRAQVMAHEAADEIIQGTYWEGGKGCFIGCIAHSDDALTAASLLGGDLMLVRIAEGIFEGLSNADAKSFPARVLLAPRVGADLSRVPWQFLHWLVTDTLATYGTNEVRAGCAAAVKVLEDNATGLPVTADAADAAAYAAARVAADAAYAARAAAYAADAARATDAAARAARTKQADKLVELLAAA